jgi:hypothetical protein
VRVGTTVKAAVLLELQIPDTKQLAAEWDSTVQKFYTVDHDKAMRGAIAKLDALVGDCFGLTPAQIDFVRKEMATDPFLKKIQPRYPGTETRKLGFLEGLDRADRYE